MLSGAVSYTHLLHAGVGGFVAIDTYRQFGLVQFEVGINVGETRILGYLGEDLAGHLEMCIRDSASITR